MAPEEPQPARAKTDESLRNERKNADEALAVKHLADEAADKLVERARSTADAVLDHARDKADDKLSEVGSVLEQLQSVVARERAQEDAILQSERDAADERLRRERLAQAEILETLLAQERANTDRYLLTERNRSDDAIAHRDDFLGMVSHDLRNLLNSINLNARILTVSASSSEEGRRTVEGMSRVQRDVSRMGRIINDLVDVVSIDAGKLAVHPEGTEVVGLLREVVDSYAAEAADKAISLSIVDTAPMLAARLDRLRIFQVLSNCISNAIKFTPRDGKITLSGKYDGKDLHISISDTGAGIEPGMSEAVFERFWQVNENDRRGMGMGLYISKCIVEGHHGKIWVESVVGRGSTFHFTIPNAI